MGGFNSLRGVSITGRLGGDYDAVLTPDAISFIAHLARLYTPRVTELLNRCVALGWLAVASDVALVRAAS